MTWPRIPLGELSVERGGSVDPSKFPDETFELFSIPAFDKGEPEIVSGKEIGSSKKCVQPNDVLISRIVPHIRRSWVVPEINGYRQIASGEWIQFRSDQIYPNFLRHFLVSDPFHQKFMKTVSGVGGSLLRARPKEVYRIKVPLPPLEEQKRIARILDTADEIRAKRRQSIMELDRLAQSVFLDMFGDPVTNPKGWEVLPIKNTNSLVQIGPFGSLLHKDDYVQDGIPLINPKHIKNDKITPDYNETINSKKFDELKKYMLEKGDVVLARRGEMGRCAIVENESRKMICGTGSLFIRPNVIHVTSVYLKHILSTRTLKAELEKLAWGVTMANLNSSKVENLKLILPPIEIQHAFEKIIQSIESQKSLHQQHLTELDNLFASLQSRAFNGTL